MPLEIDYWSEGFSPGGPITNGHGVLQTTWDDLLWAALTVGRPNRQHVFRHGAASMYEAIFRWSLVRMALEQSGPYASRLRRTSAAKTLDPSEKGAVNYFLGIIFCKLFSACLLNAPWMMHLDVFRPMLNPVLTGRSRPDLLGQTLSNEWVSIESKGRVSTPNSEAKNKAKRQAQRISSVNGIEPRFHIGAVTYFRNDVLQFFWRDPEPEGGSTPRPINLTHKDDILRACYRPTLDLISSQSESDEEMVRKPGLFRLKELDIEVGIHPVVLKLLLEESWGELKLFCIKEKETVRHDGYQPDGIRVSAGKTWVLPFAEFGTQSDRREG